MKKFIITPNQTKFHEQIKREAEFFFEKELPEDFLVYEIYEPEEEITVLDKLFDEYQELENLDDFSQEYAVRFRPVLGQFNENQEQLEKILKNFGFEKPFHHSTLILMRGLNEIETNRFANYYLNPLEFERVSFEHLDYSMGESSGKDLQKIDGFINMTPEEVSEMSNSFSMNTDDLLLCQDYFKQEGRDPSTFELNVIDTYWSDHCRHTTFFTELTEMNVKEGLYKDAIEKTKDHYEKVREEVYGDKKRDRSLMDLGTINTRLCKKRRQLEDLDQSDEINACTVHIDVDDDGEVEDYLLYFKNETHNHPTEIEPFGGAATCIGGSIRDILSGRGFVHQGMRITGGKDPKQRLTKVRDHKLPQRFICQRAAEGFSDYANKIGVPSGFVREFYDDGFEAKRMEVGSIVGFARSKDVIRENPEPGDVILLVGAKTGRDGLGAAVGSSMVQEEDAIETAGAEVQKGDSTLERKILRLFRREECSKLIKMCNDFGAGGLSVAVGELADGLHIKVDKMPVKYEGMDPSEIALAESQERMAVVIDPEHKEEFKRLAHEEDLEAIEIAEVNDSGELLMTFNGEEVLRLSRDFLDSDGAKRTSKANIDYGEIKNNFEDNREIEEQLSDLRFTSQKALAQKFDHSVGKVNLLLPYGGKNKLTEELGMVSKIPTKGYTKTTSIMAMSYLPEIAKVSPYHGGYFAIVESLAKAIALGAKKDEIRLSLQEYFPSLGEDPEKWGLPTGVLLGAFQAMTDFEVPAIGGKDSMSGSFEELEVPPTLISFAVSTGKVDRLVSRSFKEAGSNIYLLKTDLTEDDLLEKEEVKNLFNTVQKLLEEGKVLSISTTERKTVEQNLVEMALGNLIGFEITEKEYLGKKIPAGFIIETKEELDGILLGKTLEEKVAKLDDEHSLERLQEFFEEPLREVYNQIDLEKTEELTLEEKKSDYSSSAKVLIPVITGVNREYDLEKAFRKYTENVEVFVLREDLDYDESVDELVEKLKDTDILAFPGGAISGNEPVVGKSFKLLLKDERVQEEVNRLAKEKGILAIGNAAAAIIDSGLIEFGEIKRGTKLEVEYNPDNEFLSDIVTSKVVSKDFTDMKAYHTNIASHALILKAGEEFDCQIISKFNEFFPGVEGVDAISSENGRVLATIGHFEAFDEDAYVNYPVVEVDFIEQLLRVVNK